MKTGFSPEVVDSAAYFAKSIVYQPACGGVFDFDDFVGVGHSQNVDQVQGNAADTLVVVFKGCKESGERKHVISDLESGIMITQSFGGLSQNF